MRKVSAKYKTILSYILSPFHSFSESSAAEMQKHFYSNDFNLTNFRRNLVYEIWTSNYISKF